MANEYMRVTHVRAKREFMWSDYVSIVARGMEGNKQWVGTGITKENVTPENQAVMRMPLVTISLTEAQVLMDDLWACGLRPSEGSGSAGALAATQAHLKDMQTLTFKLIERGAPNPIA